MFVGGGFGNTLTSNTIVYNTSIFGYGAGVAAQSNPPTEYGALPIVNLALTLDSNIISQNDGTDVDATLFLTPDGGTDPLDSIIGSDGGGYNLIGVIGNIGDGNGFLTGQDSIGTSILGDSTNVNGDPEFLGFGDYGGPTNVYMLDHTLTNPAIDAANPGIDDGLEQRGLFYNRVYSDESAIAANPSQYPDDEMRADIGAVECQPITVYVDSLEDKNDQQFLPVYALGQIGEFNLREALGAAYKNPVYVDLYAPDPLTTIPDTIAFDPYTLLAQDDPTFTEAPTILLDPTRGPVEVDSEVQNHRTD